MNIVMSAIGLFCIFYGVYTAIIRTKNPEKFSKMEAMQKRFGEKPGKILHIIFYSFVPVIAGIIFFIWGLMGKSLF